ncbi:MAG: tryptophan synthase subunit alpha [Candidatus Omnitrophica bacterium]|nr:tryptophan synthase subunit alpha [Candidatus Omnitrophota bacterium]MBI3020703.1 tryptophan synthase subunit alpha [Candidatus Omnitrophota bacterium]
MPHRASPIVHAFERLRRARRTALIPFVMGGDPTLSMTGPLLLALEDAGADLIEVGIPFSDPLADGPIIQGASARALAHGATPARVLAAVASVRHRLRVPVVCLSYWNLLVQFDGRGAQGSLRAFVRAAQESGVSGVIVPDLPVEEHEPLRRAVGDTGFSTVLLAAPTSPPERLRAIARSSQGFIYYVSVTGTTGVRRTLPPGLTHGVRQLRLLTTKPICVGFGISTPAQAAAVARIADGVIVGSALIRAIERSRGRSAILRSAETFLRRLRNAV